MTPLMKLGHQKFLTMDDLWNLDPEYQTKKLSEKFDAAWNKELKKKRLLSFFYYIYIFLSLTYSYSYYFYSYFFYLLVHHC